MADSMRFAPLCESRPPLPPSLLNFHFCTLRRWPTAEILVCWICSRDGGENSADCGEYIIKEGVGWEKIKEKEEEREGEE